MTMPLVIYLVIMFLSIFDPAINFYGQAPSASYFISAIDVLLLGGPHLPDKIISIIGILIMVGSAVYLHVTRNKDLVMSGPYRYVRNPQYLGAVLFICNLTSRSYREVLGDVGWLSPMGTLWVWFGTLAAYILLAWVEEIHLLSVYGSQYSLYKSRTAFIIPFIRSKHRCLEIAASIVFPSLLLWFLIWLNHVLYP